jgi:acyl dehydratase
MANVTVAEARARWVGHVFDSRTFRVDEQRMLGWAQACGETDPRFVDPAHPDFQAHPTFTAQFMSARLLPEGFPTFSKRGMDGGKAVELLRPVRACDVLTGTAEVHDVYEKTGRSGTMVFIVHRMTFTNQDDEEVAVVDWRMMQALGTK